MAKNVKLNIISTMLFVGVALVLAVAIQRSSSTNVQLGTQQAMIERERYFAERQRQSRAKIEAPSEKENELKNLVHEINLLKNNCKNSGDCLRQHGTFEVMVLGAYNEKWGENLAINWRGSGAFKTVQNRTLSNASRDPLHSGIITMNMSSCRNSIKQGADYRGVGAVVVINTSEAYIARVPIAANRYDAYDLVTCSKPDGTRGVKRIPL